MPPKKKIKKSNKKSRSDIIITFSKLKKKYDIKDINFANTISKGTKASQGLIDYHYQNYSNVMNFLTKINNNNLCFFPNKDAFLNLQIEKNIKNIYPLYGDIDSFFININKCLKNKYRFIPIILNLITNEGQHANILLIDKTNKLIELYEPHGSRTSSSILGGVKGAYIKKLKSIHKLFKKHLPSYSVKNIVDYQRGTHFQMAKDPENHSGFCVTWTIIFVHYRLLNPDIDLKILMKYISIKITTTKLLQYARYIENTLK